jgi:hypothetical protein
MANKEYEKELKPYSPESVRHGLNHPNLAEPAHEQVSKYEVPTKERK